MNIENKIMQLNDKRTFYEDVRKLIGYYENKNWEDWEIKRFQRVADCRYEQLLKEEVENDKN